MEIELFDGIELEFFEISDKTPNDGEEVALILKPGVDYSGPWTWNPTTFAYERPATTTPTMTYATFNTFKTVPSKFRSTASNRIKTFYETDVICWGRIKKQ